MLGLIALLQHHLARAQSGVKFNAINNCHAQGIASIMLHDEPGNRVRMFFARANHTLWRNDPTGAMKFSLGIHPHHCAITLIGLFGQVYNDRYAITQTQHGDFELCEYHSEIKGGKGTGLITPLGTFGVPYRVLSETLAKPVSMKAWELHSIRVPISSAAAWLVVEGEEDEHYISRFWSNQGNHNGALDGLYQPMTQGEVIEALSAVIRNISKPEA